MVKLLPKLALVVIGFGAGFQTSPHPPQGPTEKEIIEILADYDVRHVPNVPGIPFYGATDHDNHTIYIVNNQDVFFKRMTVIHELIHCMHRARLEPDKDEDAVKIIEEAEYKRLFVDVDK